MARSRRLLPGDVDRRRQRRQRRRRAERTVVGVRQSAHRIYADRRDRRRRRRRRRPTVVTRPRDSAVEGDHARRTSIDARAGRSNRRPVDDAFVRKAVGAGRAADGRRWWRRRPVDRVDRGGQHAGRADLPARNEGDQHGDRRCVENYDRPLRYDRRCAVGRSVYAQCPPLSQKSCGTAALPLMSYYQSGSCITPCVYTPFL